MPRESTGGITPTQMRLSSEVLAQIDWLAEHIAPPGIGLTRTDVVRAAVHTLYTRSGGPSAPEKKSRKKSAK